MFKCEEGINTEYLTLPNMKRISPDTRIDRTDPSLKKLRKAVHAQLLKVGFEKTSEGYSIDGNVSKQRIRKMHLMQRKHVLKQNRLLIDEAGSELIRHFASGNQVDPNRIDPELIEVRANSLESELFRFTCLLWSVPVSRGFGRRLRFLVRDRQNGCLIGIFALGDPVFNLSARDQWIGWNHKDRLERLSHVMDAYIVGAVPPYAQLIGGKLIAGLIGSDEVSAIYDRKYFGKISIIGNKRNKKHLVLVTTSSALGRSSLYNRLRIPKGPQFIRIGTTRGFGHFHFSGDIFQLLRERLEKNGHPYARGNRFGMGPNWKLRVVRVALESIGLDGNMLLKHGINREVYAMPLAQNYRDILLGRRKRSLGCTLPAGNISEFCKQRWMIPRSIRDGRYKEFERNRLLESLRQEEPGPLW